MGYFNQYSKRGLGLIQTCAVHITHTQTEHALTEQTKRKESVIVIQVSSFLRSPV